MIITNKVKLDLQTPGILPTIHAVQNDSYSRNLEITLFSDRKPFVFPENGTVVIRYKKSDGKGGEYDTLPDGTAAWWTERNVLTVALAPQVLTTPGSVHLSVSLIAGGTQLSIFPIRLSVAPIAAGKIAKSENYFYITGLLPAPVSGNVGQCLRIAAVNSEGRITAVEATDSESFNSFTGFGLPVLYLTGDTTGMSKDDAVTLNYVYGERSGTAEVKWQGNSSLGYDKKNYTIKFDNAFEVVEGWGEQKKYCLKANFIDHSHARNLVSAKLWGEVVKSRTPENARLSTLPNGGAVDGFPCILMLNGAFHGLYTFNIPKDGWLFGMNDDEITEQTEVIPFKTCINEDWPDLNTAEYTPDAGFKLTFVTSTSNLSGGRAYVNWDTTQINSFKVMAYLFDETNTLVKVFVELGDSTLNPYYGKSGDFGDDAWFDCTLSTANPFNVTGPFSLPVPSGHRVMWALLMLSPTLPEGSSLTTAWSAEAEANNTWHYKWARTGVEFSLVTTSAPKEAILCADTHNDACGFKALATLTDDFELEYVSDENDSDWVLTSLNRLISAVMSSDGTDLDTTVAKYLDWQSAIDYLIFNVLLCGKDMVRKNYLLVTYDGVKWFFSAYDMDSTYGMHWDGKGFDSAKSCPFLNSYDHRVMELIYTYKKDELLARYEEIRNTTMSEDNVYHKFTNFATAIPSPVLVEDVKRWPTIPSSSASNTAQILNWYRLRSGFIDKEAEQM